MADEKLTVTLSNDDIVELANDLSKKIEGYSEGTFELIIKRSIKQRRGVDFFEEERREIEADQEIDLVKNAFEYSEIYDGYYFD